MVLPALSSKKIVLVSSLVYLFILFFQKRLGTLCRQKHDEREGSINNLHKKKTSCFGDEHHFVALGILQIPIY